MKIKQVARTVNTAWSDASFSDMYLAAGTDAQQLDASFSTSAFLEVFRVDPASPGLDMPIVGSTPVSHRFHGLAWTSRSSALPYGLLIGGMDEGLINIYNAANIFGKSGDNPLVSQTQQHSGPVRCVDLNPLQNNLLASGSSDAEVFVWDLNNPSKHLTPGPKAHPPEDVSCVGWNKQVPHILASSSLGGRTIVWDLRAGKQIIHIGDGGKVRVRALAWHGGQATQLATASEDDRSPVIQIWDLRSAFSPMKEFYGHHKGILALDWSTSDASLLLSAGKDNRTICWNVDSTEAGRERVAELPSSASWVYECAWCPRNPGLVSTSSFDGSLNVYSIFGTPQPSTTGSDPFAAQDGPLPLTRAPKWLARRGGATFAFGGKLVSFANKDNIRTVKVTRVPSDAGLLHHAAEVSPLLAATSADAILPLITHQLSTAQGGERLVWQALHASLALEPRTAYLQLLGFESEQIEAHVLALKGKIQQSEHAHTERAQNSSSVPQHMEREADVLIAHALVVGNFEAAVDACLATDKMAEALILANAGGPELLARAQRAFFEKHNTSTTRLAAAVISHDWPTLVQTSGTEQWRLTLAALLTYAPAHEFSSLVAMLVAILEQDLLRHRVDAVVCSIIGGHVDSLIKLEKHKQGFSPADKLMLVSKAITLRRSMEARQLPVKGSEAFNTLIADYVSQLIAQGALDTAYSFLSALAGNDGEGARPTLLERVAVALNAITMPNFFNGPPTPRVPQVQQAPQQYGSQQKTSPNGYQTYASPSAPANQYGGQNPAYPPQGQPTQYPPSSSSTPYSQPVPPVSRPAMPSAPTSTPPPPTPPRTVQPPPHTAAPYSNPATPQTMSNSTMSYPQSSPYSQPVSQPQPYNPVPVVPQTSAPLKPNPYLAPAPPPTKTGWNDPPDITTKKTSHASATPIMNPLRAGYTQPTPNMPQQYDQHGQPTSTYPPSSSTPVNSSQGGYPSQPAQGHPSQPWGQGVGSTQPPQGPPAPPRVPTPPPPEPIPQEYVYIHDVLNASIATLMSSGNMQQRKKAEEVSKRLDVLYAQFRAHEVDANATNFLNYIAQCIQTGDYATALQYHQALVTASNPNHAGSYLIGIKTLIGIMKQ